MDKAKSISKTTDYPRLESIAPPKSAKEKGKKVPSKLQSCVNLPPYPYRKSIFLRFFCVPLKYALCFYFKVIGKGVIEGELPPGRVLLVSNHESYLDWLLLYSWFEVKHRKKIHFIAKRKLFLHQFWRRLLIYSDAIYIPSFQRKGALALLDKILDNGGIVGIFPEGRRSRSGSLQKSHSGFVRIALRKKVQIVPVGLIGFYEAWPPNRFLPHFKGVRLKIKIGKPISLEEYKEKDLSRKDYRKITRKVMKTVGNLIGEEYDF